MSNEPLPDEGSRRRVLVPLGTAAAGILVLSATLYGARATASMPIPQGATTGGSASSGSISLVLQDSGAGFRQFVSDLAPGDVVLRDIDLVAGGSLRGRGLALTITPDRGGPLVADTSSTRALRVSVGVCDAPRRAGAGCSVPIRVLLAAVPIDRLSAARVDLGLPDVEPGQVVALQVALALPEQDETTADGVRPSNSVQGQSARLRWTFSTRQ